jgi:CheY-like chemotaxis protein
LMDIQMPGLDGLEAIRHIRAEPDPRVAQVPIIALTAIAMPGDRQRCMEAGANVYLSKPVSLKELVEVIKAQLREA